MALSYCKSSSYNNRTLVITSAGTVIEHMTTKKRVKPLTGRCEFQLRPRYYATRRDSFPAEHRAAAGPPGSSISHRRQVWRGETDGVWSTSPCLKVIVTNPSLSTYFCSKRWRPRHRMMTVLTALSANLYDPVCRPARCHAWSSDVGNRSWLSQWCKVRRVGAIVEGVRCRP